MASTKRTRPAFTPPRPRKANKTSTAKSISSTAGVAKSKNQKQLSKTNSTRGGNKPKPKPKENEVSGRRRSKLVSPTPSASDSLGGDSEDEDRASEGTDNDDEDDTRLSNDVPTDSPEPDYILAEVTESTSASEPPIPLGLVHRILHSQFSEPEKTKISTDARELVGKYVEVFVREAIMRCTFEKGGDAANETAGGGWLELEDLEKVAVQLCLDF